DPAVNGSVDRRQAQSREVQNFIAGALAADGEAKLVVLGDLNEFEFVSPLLELETVGLTNLTNALPADERYTFNFQGNSQSLDHILVSEGLAGGALVDAVHVNSEFADLETRASDHDPVLAALSVGVAPSDLSLSFAGRAVGPGATFDAPTGTFTFASDAPGLGRLTLSISNAGADLSGVFFVTCVTQAAPGAVSVRRVLGASLAGFRPEDVVFSNAGNPRVEIGSAATPSLDGVGAGETRRLLVLLGGTGAGVDTLTCTLEEALADGGFRSVNAIDVVIDNQ
ncbi:MAG: hypothetical protein AAFX85_20765, partial [Pseudomonadota bacterium]